jgi:hypothetical protein
MKIVEIFCIISSYFNIISTLFQLICTQALQCSSEPSRSPCKISRRARVRAGHRRCQFAFRCQFGFQVFNVCLRYQARTAPTLIRHSDSTKSRPAAAPAAGELRHVKSSSTCARAAPAPVPAYAPPSRSPPPPSSPPAAAAAALPLAAAALLAARGGAWGAKRRAERVSSRAFRSRASALSSARGGGGRGRRGGGRRRGAAEPDPPALAAGPPGGGIVRRRRGVAGAGRVRRRPVEPGLRPPDPLARRLCADAGGRRRGAAAPDGADPDKAIGQHEEPAGRRRRRRRRRTSAGGDGRAEAAGGRRECREGGRLRGGADQVRGVVGARRSNDHHLHQAQPPSHGRRHCRPSRRRRRGGQLRCKVRLGGAGRACWCGGAIGAPRLLRGAGAPQRSQGVHWRGRCPRSIGGFAALGGLGVGGSPARRPGRAIPTSRTPSVRRASRNSSRSPRMTRGGKSAWLGASTPPNAGYSLRRPWSCTYLSLFPQGLRGSRSRRGQSSNCGRQKLQIGARVANFSSKTLSQNSFPLDLTNFLCS